MNIFISKKTRRAQVNTFILISGTLRADCIRARVFYIPNFASEILMTQI